MKLLSTTALLVGVGAQPGPMADSPHPEPMAPVGVYPEEQTYVSCDTTKGKLEIEVNHAWAPIGAAHFLDMVKDEYYTDIALFRSVPEFIVQFGINDRTAPELRQKYMHSRPLDDDPHVGNKVLRGTLTYAGGSAHSRTSQLFFAYADQAHLPIFRVGVIDRWWRQRARGHIYLFRRWARDSTVHGSHGTVV